MKLDELVGAAAAGDRDAFATLLETVTDAASRAALAILRSPDEARDVVQQAAIRAWQQLPTLRAAESWPSWFRRITVRLALDEARRGRRSREIQLVGDLEAAGPWPLELADERLDLLSAFSRLSPQDRAVLGLRFGVDLTVPDVAAALGIPVGTAKARLHRAVARLRMELRHDES